MVIQELLSSVAVELVCNGKGSRCGTLRSIGVSNFDAGKIVEFAKLVETTQQVNQLEFNLWNQREKDQEWNKKYSVQPETTVRPISQPGFAENW
ncbi:hypothetical protein [Fructobacillus americanaquae]|uniref:Uncharacterized protein n=1 Tax=Fructobacillus americanaquae TaxID=2940302 RepID=A0ABY5C070_9LACO|nr:hypothetical protein [Fructobacillus americanaquae]USS92151.1 hypothetical protein M3M36_00610 [Fructobacillus americanaquae]